MPLLLVLCALLSAAVQRPADVVRWSAAAPAAVAPGASARISVKANVQPGWKLYAIEQPADGPEPLTFAVAKGSGFTIAAKQIVAPKAKIQSDENFGLQTRYYDNEAAFTVPVQVPASASGATQVPLEVTFQACGQNICLRPYTQKLQVPITIAR